MASDTENTEMEQPLPDDLAELMQTEIAEAAISSNTPEPEKTNGADKNLNQILSINLPVIVKIAEKRMTISEILKLNHGSLIQFDKGAYQHFDLMVNNSTIGLGQPVKIGEQFGVKITHIGDITDTIRSMGETNES